MTDGMNETESLLQHQNNLKLTVMPAGHGDCILVQCDHGRFNILVDSGPSSSAIRHRVRRRLREILGDRQVIDLAIVTHYDDDHIGGLEHALEDKTIEIRSLLFNSPQLIRRFIAGHLDDEVNVSARQACNVSELLAPCNKSVAVAGDTLHFFDKRVVLNVLSPRADDVLQFGTRMLATLQEEVRIGARGRETPICGTVADLLTFEDTEKQKQDTSQANGLSLAFILEFENRSILFLGDSWPSRVSCSLEGLRSDGGRHELNLVVVSHHGSKFNSTTDLYSKIASSRFVISADGSQHPDIDTFARIVQTAGSRNIKFYFSEKTVVLTEMFSQTDLTTVFPQDNIPLSFDL